MALANSNLLLMKTSLVLLAAATSLLAEADKPLPPPPQAKRNCQERCGNLTVPYPFGIGDGCYIPLKGQENQFNLTCDDSMKPPTLNLTGSALVISDFTISEGLLEAMNYISEDCYDEKGPVSNSVEGVAGVTLNRPFSLSGPRNTFVAVGCDTYSVFRGTHGGKQAISTGCMSLCTNITTVDQNSCSGVGCCLQNQIPDGLNTVTVKLGSYYQHKDVLSFNPCSYAFLVKANYFNFSGTRSFEQLKNTQQVPVIFNWQIGSQTCKEAQNNLVDYACKENSICHNQDKGPYSGYFCSCKEGYEGNPYIGCRDIDECKVSNRCTNGRCTNSPGSYSCLCNKGYTKGMDDQSCIQEIEPKNAKNQPKTMLLLIVSLSVTGGFLVLFVGISWICCGIKKRKFMKLKEKYFKENGGLLLLQQLANHGGSVETTKIFTTEELEKATNNYHESRVIGEGGYGTVYKGVLTDNKMVAIKRSKGGTSIQNEQFVNEVIVLSQINHRNVVKLLGCCLETAVPLLVYEFVTHGTLHEHTHKKKSSLSFELRIKIAAETAGALAYLHSSISTAIIHRDVKAANILLDDDYTAKVSDFGASRLVPSGQTEIQTLVLGTFGYLDPEYLQTNQLTEKSDVYSFGVVLVELLTSKVALSNDRCLASIFISSMEEDCLKHILDDTIVNEGNIETAVNVANLAKRCLSVKGEGRPTMKEVAMELEGMAIMAKHPWEKNAMFCAEESEHLLGSSFPDSHIMEVTGGDQNSGLTTGTTSGYDSMHIQMLMPHGDGR